MSEDRNQNECKIQHSITVIGHLNKENQAQGQSTFLSFSPFENKLITKIIPP